MKQNRFNFGDIVVVEDDYIGVVVKCWGGEHPHNEVYVRSYNGIKDYGEDEIRAFIYDKELTEEAKEYYL